MSHVAQVDAHVASGPRTTTSVLLGGVRFELLADFADTGLLEEHQRFVEHDPEGLTLAHVSAALTGTHRERGVFAPEVTRVWEGDRAVVTVGDVTTELAELAPTRFVATSRLNPDSVGVSTFLTSTTSAVVERLGGVILHAAGIEIDGRAILFIGPSGAGKTTAAHHCEGATWIARDRAAVVPYRDGYVTFGMPGGDEIDLPRTKVAVRKLACIARIRRDRPEPCIEPLGTLEALATLRESTFAGGDEAVEERRLDALLALAATVPVIDLHTRLGASLTALLTERFS